MTNKSILLIVISALLVASIYSLSTFVVFAAPPYNGYVTKCTRTYYDNGAVAAQKCCIKVYVDGKLTTSSCDPWSCYWKDGSAKKCKNTLTSGQSGSPITTNSGALQDNGTTSGGNNNTKVTKNFGALKGGSVFKEGGTNDSNNNSTPLRLNATSSTNPNAVLKDSGSSIGSNNTLQ
jgi:hypothetical protein